MFCRWIMNDLGQVKSSYYPKIEVNDEDRDKFDFHIENAIPHVKVFHIKMLNLIFTCESFSYVELQISHVNLQISQNVILVTCEK